MPVLPLEPFVYPAQLFQTPRAESASDEQWWVLHTRPRAEKSLARRLLSAECNYFLPLLTRPSRQGRKARRPDSHVPLFPSYVFLHGCREARLSALSTNLVVQVLEVVDQDRLFNDLSNVHRLMTSEAPLTPEDHLLPGTLVEITHGAFTGLRGKVLRRGSSWHLFVEVNFLKCGVSVEIEQWMIKPLPEAETTVDGGLCRSA